MLTIGSRGQIFLVAGVTDMRKAFNTLAAIVRVLPVRLHESARGP